MFEVLRKIEKNGQIYGAEVKNLNTGDTRVVTKSRFLGINDEVLVNASITSDGKILSKKGIKIPIVKIEDFYKNLIVYQ